LAKHGFPTVNRNVSVTLGVLLDDHAKQAIKFWDDPAITQTTVNITCERCPINDCSVRAAAPKVVERREARKKMQEALAKLTMLSE
jgi:hypothetical protein